MTVASVGAVIGQRPLRRRFRLKNFGSELDMPGKSRGGRKSMRGGRKKDEKKMSRGGRKMRGGRRRR